MPSTSCACREMGDSFLAGEQGLLRTAAQDVCQAHHGQGLARAFAFASTASCAGQGLLQRQRPVSRRRCQTAQEAEDRQWRRIAFVQPSPFEPPVWRVFRFAALPRAPAAAATTTFGRLFVLVSRAHERSRHAAAQSSASALPPVGAVIPTRPRRSSVSSLVSPSPFHERFCTSTPGALCVKPPFPGSSIPPSPVFVARYRALPPAYHALLSCHSGMDPFRASMRRTSARDNHILKKSWRARAGERSSGGSRSCPNIWFSDCVTLLAICLTEVETSPISSSPLTTLNFDALNSLATLCSATSAQHGSNHVQDSAAEAVLH